VRRLQIGIAGSCLKSFEHGQRGSSSMRLVVVLAAAPPTAPATEPSSKRSNAPSHRVRARGVATAGAIGGRGTPVYHSHWRFGTIRSFIEPVTACRVATIEA